MGGREVLLQADWLCKETYHRTVNLQEVVGDLLELQLIFGQQILYIYTNIIFWGKPLTMVQVLSLLIICV